MVSDASISLICVILLYVHLKLCYGISHMCDIRSERWQQYPSQIPHTERDRDSRHECVPMRLKYIPCPWKWERRHEHDPKSHRTKRRRLVQMYLPARAQWSAQILAHISTRLEHAAAPIDVAVAASSRTLASAAKRRLLPPAMRRAASCCRQPPAIETHTSTTHSVFLARATRRLLGVEGRWRSGTARLLLARANN